MQNKLMFLPKSKEMHGLYRSGVSLHGHTSHSIESLACIGKYLFSHCVIRPWLSEQRDRCKRESGISLNFDRAYWTPPLDPRSAYDLEAGQIQALGMRPLVSLSDHNTIAASALLRREPAFETVPVSVEWTLPFGRAVFHIGVHNIPGSMADDVMSHLRRATAAADERQALYLLHELSAVPSLLLVFNHPRWNFNGITAVAFDAELRRFLEQAVTFLHAFELNGMRSHRENAEVIKLAAEWNRVVISGGDRHACEPNAMLNLTQATELCEFVEEVRQGISTVLIMPHYAEPLHWRFFKNFTEVVREYPHFPEGRRKWDERTFHPNLDGEIVPMIDLWPNGPPAYLRKIFAAAMLLARVPAPAVWRSCIESETELLRLPTALAKGLPLAEAFAGQQADQS